MAIKQSELDALVRQIGDELLTQLQSFPMKKILDETSLGKVQKPEQFSEVVVADLDYLAGESWTPPEKGVASLISCELLSPNVTGPEIENLCLVAGHHGFAAVCVQPSWVSLAVKALHGSAVTVSTVIGFPHGTTVTPVKLVEAEQVMKLGAKEIEVVVNIGAVKSSNRDLVYSDIRSIVELAHQASVMVTVILETGFLNEEEKITGCALAKLAGADAIKTSTGFSLTGTKSSDVALLSKVVAGTMGIEASGEIRSYRAMEVMMSAGATRIGSAHSLEILQQASPSHVSISQ